MLTVEDVLMSAGIGPRDVNVVPQFSPNRDSEAVLPSLSQTCPGAAAAYQRYCQIDRGRALDDGRPYIAVFARMAKWFGRVSEMLMLGLLRDPSRRGRPPAAGGGGAPALGGGRGLPGVPPGGTGMRRPSPTPNVGDTDDAP